MLTFIDGEPLKARLLLRGSTISSFWAAAPKGSVTYAFTLMGNFLLLPLLPSDAFAFCSFVLVVYPVTYFPTSPPLVISAFLFRKSF